MAKRSRSKSSSSEPLSDSPEDERVNDQVNDEVDEEELEAAGRAAEDSEAEDQDGEEDNDDEEENEEDDAGAKKDNTQHVLEAQNAGIDADMVESMGSSSFCVDLNDKFESEDQSNGEKPSTGRKKVKKLLNEEFNQFFTSIEANYEQIKRMFQQTQDLLQKNYEIQLLKAQVAARKIEMEKQREENKILCMNLDSICNPMMREVFRNEQLKIVAKRDNQSD